MVRPSIWRRNTLRDDIKACSKNCLKSYSLRAIYQCAVVNVIVNCPRKAMAVYIVKASNTLVLHIS